ncbi:hypothetical protein RHMOL_Rhmol08G0269400 [Rhododendron molle]|uniref:Uncharacterized protein n=1 Tax=Rhododendron molle TaxID=49168 RepID=A0ACC0MV01_RHOML|nr:hypothetical protein RHMOL_Rhmol08G0269400 [Rhododendron molle]
MLPGYGSEGFLNKDVSVVKYEWNRPISEKSDQKLPLQALPHGLPLDSPLFTKNGIGLEWSKNRMQQYNDVWDISKCRGMGGRGNRTDARGLGYPEYIQDLHTKQSLLMARTKGRGKKFEGKGEKTISQPDANTGVVPPALVSPCETPQAHTLLGKRKAKNKWKKLGFIFMCNARTKPECYRYRVFGLPAGRREDVEKVKKGMKLFLFDYDVKLLYGVYEATSDGQMNLEPSAFGGNFPAQVSFAIHKECLPLHETVFKFALRDNYEGFKFKAELTRQQVKDLSSLFPALSTAASVASVPQVAPSQAIRRPALVDQFQPPLMLPPSQDPYLAGAQPGYAAPIVEPHSVQQRVLNDPYYYAESQRPHLAEDNARITRDPYSRYVGLQQMAPRDQFANIAAGYYNYPTTATSHSPQLTHLPRFDVGYDLQRENVAGYYTTYPIPATSLGPPLVHHPHGGREFDQQREDVARSHTAYPIPASSQGPPVMHHPHGGSEFDLQREDVVRSYTTFPIPATSQGPPLMHPHGQFPGTPPIPATSQGPTIMHPHGQFPRTPPIPATSQGPPVMHPHGQFPGTPMSSFPVSFNYFFDGTNQGAKMGNCCNGGGGTAVGGADFSPGGGPNDAVDYFLTSHGQHGLFSQIELSLSASNLHDRDALSKSDPMAVIYGKGRDGVLKEIGRTEVVLNSLNPKWIRKHTVAYHFEVVQTLLFRVYDVDSQWHDLDVKMLKLDDQEFLGEATCTLSEIVTKTYGSLTLDLVQEDESNGSNHSRNFGTLTVHAEESVISKTRTEFIFRCSDLESKDLFSKSDPFLVISKTVESGAPIPICKTEVLQNDLNPTWKPIYLNVQQVGSKDTPLIIECFNFNSNGKHDLIGKVQESLADLEKLHSVGQGEHLSIPTAIGHNHHKKICKSQLFVDKFCEKVEHTFLDYLSHGCQLNFMVAIDFTASNGNPRLPDSLHYIDPSGRPNAYQRAILDVGEVLQFYDSDKRFPAWGFGARPIDGPVSHCFNLNGSSNYCEVKCTSIPFHFDSIGQVEGIQGIMTSYTNALFNVSLAGPTLFGHVITTAAQIAAQALAHNQQKYFVLLIITDGVITDLQETKDALVKASDLPLSILIVGVGGADFKEMEILDADKYEKLESSTGRVASRDIVQFVPFRDVHSGEVSVVQSLLAELPSQFLTYMRNRDMQPTT